MNISQPVILDGPDWTCCFSPGDREKLVFKYAGRELLAVSGISLGKVDESSAYCTKSQKHEAADLLNSSFHTVNTLPFGSEPTITRTCEISGNHAVITTDCDMRHKMEVASFEVDNLVVKGEWTRIGVVKISNPIPSIGDIEWHDVGQGGDFRLELDHMPLLILFERSDKFMVEVGNGDDLWRWLNTSVFPGSSQSVVIEKTDGGIGLRRIVAKWDECTIMGSRQYRFNWYFSWEAPGKEYFKRRDDASGKSDDGEYFRFPEGDVPMQLAACHGSRNLNVSCLHSPAVSGIFRSIIRSALGNSEPRNIVIENLTVPLCENAAHLERPQKQVLLHWNMLRIFDHWLWANKQLKNSGVSFYALPAGDGKIFSVLPSVRGLSEIR
ncbi:MAG TPA: hypothetical protein DET40_02425 [Lentisphaeria bacterium]|nr:MAG: hypothetical protein A2X45_20480 [Lentisphaerae bacterium GWF2_50_93]HCE42388.1 hypothetical protein [Lentisphaeria bacterium]